MVLRRAGARAEELDRLRLGERRDRVLHLAAHAQQLTARDKHREVRAGLDERREFRRRLDDLLEVVEQDQQLALADVFGKAVLGSQRLRDCRRNERGIAQRRERNPEDAVQELHHELRGGLDPEARLA